MTEKQLNESIIKDKIQGICQDCIYLDKIVPIINQMLEEQYIKGLEQGKLDKKIEKQQLISWLEDKIKEYEGHKKYLYEKQNTKLVEKSRIIGCIGVYQEVLDYVKGDMK